MSGGTKEKAPVEPRTADASRRQRLRIEWWQHLNAIRSELESDDEGRPDRGEARRVVVYYALDVDGSLDAGGLVLQLFQRVERQDGELGVMKKLSVREGLEPGVGKEDRRWIELLSAIAMRGHGRGQGQDPGDEVRERAQHEGELVAAPVIAPAAWEMVLPQLAETGRLLLWPRGESRPRQRRTLAWDAGEPWRFRLVFRLEGDGHSERAMLRGVLHRGGSGGGPLEPATGTGDPEGYEEVPVGEPELVLAAGLVVFRDRIARLDAEGQFPWISRLRLEREIELPPGRLIEAVTQLYELPSVPAVELPPEIEVRAESEPPVPRLEVRRFEGGEGVFLLGTVTFLYGGTALSPLDDRAAVADGERLLARDREAEEAALAELEELGLELHRLRGEVKAILQPGAFARQADHLLALGWRVTAEGARVRRSGAARLSVDSRIDWFEVHGGVEFDGVEVPFPTLLKAARRGAGTVPLGDGTVGLLPERWMKRWGGLKRLAQEEEGGALRFGRSQGFLLDVLLSEVPGVGFDDAFSRYRAGLEELQEVEPAVEPAGFRGTLRPYQRVGLGWLRRLAETRMGGCLADDMGLGKTVQALAWLEERREEREAAGGERRPSLVVAPKSLVFNWAREAERFTPRLAVLDYTGPRRESLLEEIRDVDVVLTTYDTLWRDIADLRQVRFDAAILDEAQAIKNPETQRAKACRLLQADHRFVLTGTPVENHLGDLWSIFEFLNPGLLGRLGKKNLARKTPESDREEIERLGRALAPFILRRAKEQVERELPEKTEQVLYCDLSARERELYEELKRRFQAEMAGHLQEKGLARSKIHVLEALLRLRQAACHPGLVDPERVGEESAKVELLVEQLEEVLDEGHKALVFSQFTSLLAIVRRRLEADGVVYEYLDGQTRDRAARVDRFQGDPECGVFLVSLKAGGLGLNLTAAEYVFILDPWWNPAVEAQAVDRTHRIGQTRPVFAYRVISRGTVEEKVLVLQERKRELAEAVVGGEKGFVGKLTEEDLGVLLG